MLEHVGRLRALPSVGGFEAGGTLGAERDCGHAEALGDLDVLLGRDDLAVSASAPHGLWEIAGALEKVPTDRRPALPDDRFHLTRAAVLEHHRLDRVWHHSDLRPTARRGR